MEMGVIRCKDCYTTSVLRIAFEQTHFHNRVLWASIAR
jgi:hypothetical protein